MKKIFPVLLISMCVALFSCKKETSDTRVVKVSHPSIALMGSKYVSVNVGESYTDPGATGTDDISGATSTLKAGHSTLDVSKPGLYYMSYSMKNANGYSTTVGRYIAVTNYQDNTDLSGTYARTSNSLQVTLTKVSRALYKTSDMGGAGLPDAAYFAVIDESTIDFGPQLSESIGTEIDATNEGLTISPTKTSYQYKLVAPGYGTALRVFVKVQ